MPELPEIETVKLQLSKVLVGRTIEKVEILNNKTFQGRKEVVEGKKVLGVRRMAKVLLIDLESEIAIAFHFKMTGQLIFVDNDKRIAGGHPTEDFVGKLPSKHTRVIFHLDKGELYFNDQRIFGWVKVGTKEEIQNMKFLKELGPEPFEMNEEEFIKRVGKSRKPVKLVLLDQTVLSGVGNIYANDALWEAEIDPRLRSDQITRNKLQNLFEAVKKVLEEGIKYGGATAADAKYIDLHGLGGHYQDHFRVYDRTGEKCLRNDGGVIQRFELGGRGTYFCPVCQE